LQNGTFITLRNKGVNMRFIVKRTSGLGWDDKQGTRPTENATLETVELKTSRGELTRDEWVVEIDSLEALIELVDKEKTEIVVDNDKDRKSLPSIEIYDDYRE
jgi:hypothetical protein